MPSIKKYVLEYWIDLNRFSREQLENHVKEALGKFSKEVNLKVQKKESFLILHITATDVVIDSCHDKLNFDRDWSFRAKDELGEVLRAKAYPILAEIELRLRSFINQAMINVLGFNWWDSVIPEKIQEKTRGIEERSGKKYQAKLQHHIEFTFFEDLIVLVTTKFQNWSSDKIITVNDFCELLSACNSINDIQKEVDARRKVVSFWDDVFSSYFDNESSWHQLEKELKKTILPLRNKVMHHRLVRLHELRQLEQFRDEVKQVLSLAKNTLSASEFEEIQPNIRIITDKLKSQIDPELLKRAIQTHNIDPELLKQARQLYNVDPELLKQARQPHNIDPELLKQARQLYNIDPGLQRQLIPAVKMPASQGNADSDKRDLKSESEVSTPDPSDDSEEGSSQDYL